MNAVHCLVMDRAPIKNSMEGNSTFHRVFIVKLSCWRRRLKFSLEQKTAEGSKVAFAKAILLFRYFLWPLPPFDMKRKFAASKSRRLPSRPPVAAVPVVLVNQIMPSLKGFRIYLLGYGKRPLPVSDLRLKRHVKGCDNWNLLKTVLKSALAVLRSP